MHSSVGRIEHTTRDSMDSAAGASINAGRYVSLGKNNKMLVVNETNSSSSKSKR